MLMFLASMQNTVAQRLHRDDRGATAVEYGLIIALVAVAIVVGLTALGTNLGTLFSTIATKISSITP